LSLRIKAKEVIIREVGLKLKGTRVKAKRDRVEGLELKTTREKAKETIEL
jgi:hypothetical protein